MPTTQWLDLVVATRGCFVRLWVLGAVVCVVRGDAWPVLLSPCNPMHVAS